MKTGLVHIYTGDGKGKTTAALGLGFRAWGRGFRVLLVQFLKGAFTGELEAIATLGERFTVHRGHDTAKFTWQMNPLELAKAKMEQQNNFDFAKKAVFSDSWDLVILDEVLGAIGADLIDRAHVLQLIEQKPLGLELVLTGRNAPLDLIDKADYVSEIKALRHPIEKGIAGRVGIES